MVDYPFSSVSEAVANFIYHYGNQQQVINSPEGIPCMGSVNAGFNIIYTPLDTVKPISLRRTSYHSVPGLYTLLDGSSMEVPGIFSIHSSPALGNRGRSIFIGATNTGINYTSPLFWNPDGTTGIDSIWGQGPPEGKALTPPGILNRYNADGVTHGTEYTKEQISQVLESNDPFTLVPSTGTNRHEIFLAGIAAGSFPPREDSTEAAPECELSIIRLRPTRRHPRDFCPVSDDTDTYQENDITVRTKCLYVEVFSRGKPLVILLGIGSNLGGHEGTSLLSVVPRDISRYLDTAAVIVASSKTGRGHHYMGTIPTGESSIDAKIRVGQPESQRGLVVKLQASTIDTYSVGFLSPSGETVSRTPAIAGNKTSIPFLLGPTTVTANYQLIGAGSGRQPIFMHSEALTTGIWKIHVHNIRFLTGQFNMRLLTHNLIPEKVVFLTPSFYTTITLPGDAPSPIAVGAYNHLNNSIYIHSSRGYVVGELTKPDLVAPGVDISEPAIGYRIGTPAPMTTRTGTSVTATHVTGTAANFLRWGIVEGNNTTMSEASARAYLIRGARGGPTLSYPNRGWGYEILDLHEAFLRSREQIPLRLPVYHTGPSWGSSSHPQLHSHLLIWISGPPFFSR